MRNQIQISQIWVCLIVNHLYYCHKQICVNPTSSEDTGVSREASSLSGVARPPRPGRGVQYMCVESNDYADAGHQRWRQKQRPRGIQGAWSRKSGKATDKTWRGCLDHLHAWQQPELRSCCVWSMRVMLCWPTARWAQEAGLPFRPLAIIKGECPGRVWT